MKDLFAKCSTNTGFFGDFRLAQDNYFSHPTLNSPPGPYMEWNGKMMLSWAINDYLGLAGHPRIIAAAKRALDIWGVSGPMGARILTGNTDEHIRLEERLAKITNKPAALLFNFGYLGVLSTITAMVERGDTVLIDLRSHACIVDGAHLAQIKSGIRMRPFRHNDVADLERQLQIVEKENKGGALIVTEGVFGMSGELGALKDICKIKAKYNARLFVDDAHGFGPMGETGRGTGEYFGVQDQIDLYFTTFAKSFACIGGVTTGDVNVIDYIRYNAKQVLTSKTMPMVLVAAIHATLDIMLEEPERRIRLWKVTKQLQMGLKNLGFKIGTMETPITPVYVPAGDMTTAANMMRYLRDEKHIFVSAIVYPIVPRGVVIFRLIPTQKHGESEVAKTLEAFADVKEKFNLKSSVETPSIEEGII